MKHKIIFMGMALLAVLSGCKEERLGIESESTIPVRVQELKPKSIKEFVTATGTVFAIREVELKTEQAGRYRLHLNPRSGSAFRMGDSVKKDEILISLDNPEFVNQVAFESRKLNYESSEREYNKQKNIYEMGGITLRELTDSERAFIDAKYNFENAALALKKLEIKAPYDGVVTDLPHYTDSQWVEANTSVIKLMDYSRLYAELTLPGKEMERVAREQEVTVSDYSLLKNSQTGKVTQISPALDPESRMFKLKIEIPNTDLRLKPGTFVRADIVVQEKDSALVIPKDVILDRRGAKTVFVVDRGFAVERRLQTGIENRDEVEVLSGLRPDDRLIVEGFETLRNRSRVKTIQ